MFYNTQSHCSAVSFLNDIIQIFSITLSLEIPQLSNPETVIIQNIFTDFTKMFVLRLCFMLKMYFPGAKGEKIFIVGHINCRKIIDGGWLVLYNSVVFV
ncbi:hypothetical protein ES703_87112 [subsurface metagenome]